MQLKTDVLALSARVALVALVALLVPTAALAAGGDLPRLVQDMGVGLLMAGALAIIFARLHIPSIAAFILAGVLLGPQVFGVITDPENIDSIAQMGFVMLLFVIGLEIDVRGLLTRGRSMAVAGLVTYPVTMAFGFIVAKGFLIIGLGGAFGEHALGAFYLGIAIAASSSLLVFKLFQQRLQLDTLPGRIAITVLVFEDIWAIVIALLQPNLNNPDLLAILFTFVGIGVLIAITYGLSQSVFHIAFKWIAKSPELVLLGALSWCFLIVWIGTHIDAATGLVGLHMHMNVSAGMAALIAGATIASLPYAGEIVTKVGLVKDFFLTLFFVSLGITIPAITDFSIPITALGVALLALISRPLIFFPAFYFLGIDRRSAAVTAIRLAQMSEFSLVLAFIGLQLGHINAEVASIITIAFVITALATTPLFDRAYHIYDWAAPFLTRLGFREPPETAVDGGHGTELLILGMHRDASSLLHELGENHPTLIQHTTVVDFNVALHDQVREYGFHVSYGDISNEEALLHAGAQSAKVIVCTISDDLLRGIRNVELVRMLRRLNPSATIIANAISIHEYDQVKAAGADIVYMARLEVARSLCEAVGHAMSGTVEEYLDKQLQRSGTPSTRREVFI